MKRRIGKAVVAAGIAGAMVAMPGCSILDLLEAEPVQTLYGPPPTFEEADDPEDDSSTDTTVVDIYDGNISENMNVCIYGPPEMLERWNNNRLNAASADDEADDEAAEAAENGDAQD